MFALILIVLYLCNFVLSANHNNQEIFFHDEQRSDESFSGISSQVQSDFEFEEATTKFFDESTTNEYFDTTIEDDLVTLYILEEVEAKFDENVRSISDEVSGSEASACDDEDFYLAP